MILLLKVFIFLNSTNFKTLFSCIPIPNIKRTGICFFFVGGVWKYYVIESQISEILR
jgi:hypothetical protein